MIVSKEAIGGSHATRVKTPVLAAATSTTCLVSSAIPSSCGTTASYSNNPTMVKVKPIIDGTATNTTTIPVIMFVTNSLFFTAFR